MEPIWKYANTRSNTMLSIACNTVICTASKAFLRATMIDWDEKNSNEELSVINFALSLPLAYVQCVIQCVW